MRGLITALLTLLGSTAGAQECLQENADRRVASEFVAEFAQLSPSVASFICTIPNGALRDHWADLADVMFEAEHIFWFDWKDSIVGTLDPDYAYPYFTGFLQARGLPALTNRQREHILTAANPNWRTEYYLPYNMSLDPEGYVALREHLRSKGRELLIYDTGSDGWGLLIGSRDAAQYWSLKSVGYATVYTLEDFL